MKKFGTAFDSPNKEKIQNICLPNVVMLVITYTWSHPEINLPSGARVFGKNLHEELNELISLACPYWQLWRDCTNPHASQRHHWLYQCNKYYLMFLLKFILIYGLE